jgi:alcohol sulfotransferase
MTELDPAVTTRDAERRLVCGYPKTGRTWLRFMMANALAEEHGLGIDIDLNNVYSVVPNEETGAINGQPTFAYGGSVPKIEMSHRRYQEGEATGSRLVFMTRDPRDIMVSHWLHDSLQVKIFDGSLREYVRDPGRGISAFLGHLESWAPHLEHNQIVAYEEMCRSPREVVTKIFQTLGVTISDGSVEHAVSQGEIGRMRQIEIDSGIAGHDYDRSNPEARRIRAGKIGGFIQYLEEADLSFIDSAITKASEPTQLVIATTPYPVTYA